ncbi:MAG TPA: hypothetical protein VGE09_08575 [Pseudoxanthomonas sp.]
MSGYISGKYQSSPTAYPSGSDVQIAVDTYGNVQTKVVDGTTGLAVSLTGSYVNMTAGATTVIKSGAGVLFAVIVNNPGTTQTLTLYDNTAASGTKIATITLSASASNLQYGLNFGTGLTAVLSGTADVTIVYA